MTDISKVPAKVRERKLPELIVGEKGRAQMRGGRWSLGRVAEFLIRYPSWQSLDDLAYFVYGYRGQANRDNVRKHIPTQRRYMLNQIEQPIVTQFSERGRIVRVKLYNQTDENDKMLLKTELDRALERKEVSEKRYEHLVKFYLLPSPKKGS